MRLNDLDGLTEIGKQVSEQSEQNRKLAEAATAGFAAANCMKDVLEGPAMELDTLTAIGRRITEQHSKIVEAATAGFAAADRYRDVFERQAEWANPYQHVHDLVRAQTEVYDSIRPLLENQLLDQLSHVSKLLPDWKALSWNMGSTELSVIQQLADEARRHVEFVESLGIETREAAERSELFDPRVVLPPVVPPRRQPEPVLAELIEAQGEAELTLGKLAFTQEMWAEAARHFKKAAKWLRDSAEPHIGLGFVFNVQGEHKRALKAFERAERRDPECFTRPDVRAAYEASLQERRWNRRLDEDPSKGN